MADFLRPCSAPLALALQGGAELWSADIFTFTLVDGVTIYRWAAWDSDLSVTGQVYSSSKPWIERSEWSVENQINVPSMKVMLATGNDSFNGGGNLKLQIHNGLFDSATFLFSRVFMTSPNITTTLGQIDLFGGIVGGIDLDGVKAELNCLGKTTLLDQNAPRNIWQIPCNHAFCDAGCTLSRGTYTYSFTVGASPTSTFIPWSAAPGTEDRFINGTMTLAAGSARRNVQAADATGLYLAYPLISVPAPGDTFTAFEGCDKSYDSGSNQSCTSRANTQHHRGFEFVPPPNAAV